MDGQTYITTDFQFRTNTELCASAFGDANRLYYPIFVALEVEGPLVEGASCDVYQSPHGSWLVLYAAARGATVSSVDVVCRLQMEGPRADVTCTASHLHPAAAAPTFRRMPITTTRAALQRPTAGWEICTHENPSIWTREGYARPSGAAESRNESPNAWPPCLQVPAMQSCHFTPLGLRLGSRAVLLATWPVNINCCTLSARAAQTEVVPSPHCQWRPFPRPWSRLGPWAYARTAQTAQRVGRGFRLHKFYPHAQRPIRRLLMGSPLLLEKTPTSLTARDDPFPGDIARTFQPPCESAAHPRRTCPSSSSARQHSSRRVQTNAARNIYPLSSPEHTYMLSDHSHPIHHSALRERRHGRPLCAVALPAA